MDKDPSSKKNVIVAYHNKCQLWTIDQITFDMSNKITILFALVMSLLFIGCATQKDTEAELKGLKKAMKNLNARFNGYHNSKVLLKEANMATVASRQDNYNQVLDLYDEVAAEGGGGGQLDPVIEKASVVVSLYRQSKWTDDAYMQIGMGEYYKGNHQEAAETFQYIINNYDPLVLVRKRGEALKRSKDAKDREKGRELLKNPEPAKKDYKTRQRDAMVWLARTLIEQENFGEAELVLEQIDAIEDLSKPLRRDLSIVKSFYELKQKNYAAAIPALQEGLELTRNKRKKTRLTYILAQLYDLQGNNSEALANYKRVTRLRPTYDMEFRSRLNIATNGFQSGSSSSKATLAALKRMSKDAKNDEFRDQIFYVMADIYAKENNMPLAIEHLNKSLRSNRGNQPQKADSYLRLAEIYFAKENYVFAKNYYDSTKTTLASTDERYEAVERYSEALTDIAANLEIIALQDSLLNIKNMSEDERLALAKKLKKERLDEEKKAALASTAESMMNPRGMNAARQEDGNKVARPNISDSGLPTSGISGPNSGNSNYWAYNTSEVKKGKRDFEKKWGKRPLEDNWRRSQNQGIATLEDDGVVTGFGRVRVSDAEVDAMFADVPKTAKEVEAANDKIIEALFALGSLYDNKLDKPQKSIDAFEELLSRFPGNKYEAEALYALYTIAMDNNPGKAATYKNRLLDKYPNSKFAVALANPEVLAEMQRGEDNLEIYYDETYLMYENGSYSKAKSRIGMADSLFGAANEIAAKFDLLNALCVGHTEGEDAYKASLNQVITKHKTTEEGEKAKEILAFLEGKNPALVSKKDGKPDQGEKTKKEKEAKQLFSDNKDQQHYVLVILSSPDIKSSQVKSAVSDYHKEHHKLDKLFTASLLLDKNTQMLVVRRFKNADIAGRYVKSVRGKSKQYLNDIDDSYRVYAISQNNYKSLLRSKKLNEYALFYEENYK